MDVAKNETLAQTLRNKLGLSLVELTPELAARYRVNLSNGFVIDSVRPDSPATAAGLPNLSINARTDVYLAGIGEPEGRYDETVRRDALSRTNDEHIARDKLLNGDDDRLLGANDFNLGDLNVTQSPQGGTGRLVRPQPRHARCAGIPQVPEGQRAGHQEADELVAVKSSGS
mgnify:CR=1 FL=1